MNTNKQYKNLNRGGFGDYLNEIEMHSQVNMHSFGCSNRNNNHDTKIGGGVFCGNSGRLVTADYCEWYPGPPYFEFKAKDQMQSLWNSTIYDISQMSSVCWTKRFTRCSWTKHIWLSYTCHWSLTTPKHFEYLLISQT